MHAYVSSSEVRVDGPARVRHAQSAEVGHPVSSGRPGPRRPIAKRGPAQPFTDGSRNYREWRWLWARRPIDGPALRNREAGVDYRRMRRRARLKASSSIFGNDEVTAVPLAKKPFLEELTEEPFARFRVELPEYTRLGRRHRNPGISAYSPRTRTTSTSSGIGSHGPWPCIDILGYLVYVRRTDPSSGCQDPVNLCVRFRQTSTRVDSYKPL